MPASMSDPSDKPFSFVASDSSADNRTFRSLRVGTGGDVAVVRKDGVVCVIPDVLSGETLPVEGVRVNATGTSASGFTGYE